MRARASILAATATALFSAPLAAQGPSGLAPAKVEAVERLISAAMSRRGIPGLSVALAQDGEIRYSSGYGLADVENDIPAKAVTLYRLGSISKTLTATAVMQLAEREKLDLDAPIQKYVPSFPEKPWPITARQLLAHLGGIRDYSEGEFASIRHYTSVTEALAVFKDDPLVHEPGTRFLYSTYGYTLLGAAVEGAAGETFLNHLRKNVLEPAGMERTTADDVFAILANRAQGYQRNASGSSRTRPWPTPATRSPAVAWPGPRRMWRASPSPSSTACW